MQCCQKAAQATNRNLGAPNATGEPTSVDEKGEKEMDERGGAMYDNSQIWVMAATPCKDRRARVRGVVSAGEIGAIETSTSQEEVQAEVVVGGKA